MKEVQELYEAIYDWTFARNNFQKKPGNERAGAPRKEIYGGG